MKTKTKYLLLAGLILNGTAYSAEVSYGTFRSVDSEVTSTSTKSDWLNLSFDSSFKKRRYQGMMDADVRFYYGQSKYMYSVPEAYIHYQTLDSDLYFGRKKLNWNRADSDWNLANHNGLQGFNLLGDKEEGLFGVHAVKRLGHGFKFKGFASFVHVPSLNPGYEVKNDGTIETKTSWQTTPPTHMRINDKLIPIKYKVDEYSATKIALQNTLAASLSYDWKGGNVQAYGMYKPENNLRINAEGSIDDSGDHLNVLVSPQVNHHFVYGMNASQKIAKRTTFSCGFEVIDPNADLDMNVAGIDAKLIMNNDKNVEMDHFEVLPTYERQSYVHTGLNYVSSYFKMGLNYIYNFADQSGENVFGDAVKWQNAVGVTANYDFNDNLSFLFDFKYDMEMKDNIMKNEISYKFLNQVSIAVGLELLKAPNEDSYWSAYRANDMIYSNFGYAF